MTVGAGPTLLLTCPGWKHDEEDDFLLKENTYLHHQPLLHAVDDAVRLESPIDFDLELVEEAGQKKSEAEVGLVVVVV